MVEAVFCCGFMKYERTVGLGLVWRSLRTAVCRRDFWTCLLEATLPAQLVNGSPASLRSQGLSPPGPVALLLWTQMTLPSPVHGGIACVHVHMCVHAQYVCTCVCVHPSPRGPHKSLQKLLQPGSLSRCNRLRPSFNLILCLFLLVGIAFPTSHSQGKTGCMRM